MAFKPFVLIRSLNAVKLVLEGQLCRLYGAMVTRVIWDGVGREICLELWHDKILPPCLSELFGALCFEPFLEFHVPEAVIIVLASIVKLYQGCHMLNLILLVTFQLRYYHLYAFHKFLLLCLESFKCGAFVVIYLLEVVESGRTDAHYSLDAFPLWLKGLDLVCKHY